LTAAETAVKWGNEDTSIAIVAIIAAREGLPAESVGPALTAVVQSMSQAELGIAAMRSDVRAARNTRSELVGYLLFLSFFKQP
jgi:hypothetical protein